MPLILPALFDGHKARVIKEEMPEKWGVIVIDLQGDFTEWKRGSLAVPGSDEDYVKDVENATRRLKELGIPIFGTQD